MPDLFRHPPGHKRNASISSTDLAARWMPARGRHDG